MNPISPQFTDLSPNPSTASAERRQPTYTTVGSIYNPDAATPIQPPTRRPRARRFQPTAQSPIENSLSYQNGLLAALPVKDTMPNSPTPGANRVPQYSQLQQNYDRAVSPQNVDERTTIPSAFGMSVPNLRSGNIPPPILRFGDSLEEKPAALDTAEDGDFLVTGNTLPIAKFNTPSLTNLASYSNPMQQAARNTLAKARSLNHGAARTDTPSLSQLSSDSARTRTDSIFGPPSSTAGAPLPLEAGPPGRRQFNQSTFEGTMRALRLGQEGQTKLSQSPAGGIQSKADSNVAENRISDLLANSQIESYGSVDQTSYYPYLADTMDPLFGSTSAAPHPLNGSTEPFVRSVVQEDRPLKRIHDTLPLQAIKIYYSKGLADDYSGRYEEIPDDWVKQYPLPGNGYVQSHEDQDEKLARINRKFYSGTERFIKNIDQVQIDYDHRRFTKSLGVIGGERQRYQKRQDDTIRRTDGRIQPRPLSIEEANGMDDSMHAAPLLSMAYGTLMQWKEASEYGSLSGNRWGPSFSQPDPAYIDTSKGGNSSFFSQEKADPPKKKRLVRKIRRGY